MQIGRLLRQHEAQVTTDNCLSSCVLILIGGVERNVYTYSTLSSFAKRARGIGLHRPYFSTVSPSLSSSEIAQKRQKLTAEIAAYLQEMNVSSRLLDLMEAVPPEKMKFLTAAEVSDLGLDAPDPVWDEKDVAARAAAHGVTSSEFRRRRVSVEAICPSAVGTARHSAAQIEESLDCAEAVGWGLGLGEYRSRKQQFEKWLRVTYGAEALGQFRDWSEKDKAPVRNCRIKFMVAGAQACER